MVMSRGNQKKLIEKPAPVALCPPKTAHKVTRNCTRISGVRKKKVKLAP
jgi:hypothetical protein